MVLNRSNSSNLEQLALKGLTCLFTVLLNRQRMTLTPVELLTRVSDPPPATYLISSSLVGVHDSGLQAQSRPKSHRIGQRVAGIVTLREAEYCFAGVRVHVCVSAL